MALKQIPGYLTYFASDDGRIYSTRSKKFLRPRTRKDGYQQVTLCEGGDRRQEYVHRLIALAWHGESAERRHVNHIDENKQNNTPENLEWVTAKENNNHGTRTTRQTETVGHERLASLARAASMKRRHPVRCIDTGVVYASVADACRANDIKHHGNLVSACTGRYHTCGGYRWEYTKEG